MSLDVFVFLYREVSTVQLENVEAFLATGICMFLEHKLFFIK